MYLSRYFLPIIKENPSEAAVVSHRLMLRAGMIRQLSAGLYNWLPLGLKVLRNIEKIVREEMDNAGALELLMPTIQPAELWQESGRYDAYGKEMLRIIDRHEHHMLYGPTNEEVITDIFRKNVRSYKDLPLNLYHIQWKFRDEIRPRFGLMRGREFLMKDAYSFHVNEEDAKREYFKMYDTYHRIFARLGLVAIAVNADTGSIGGSLSHEFQVLAETGESQIYYDAEIDKLRSSIGATQAHEIGEKLRGLYAAADEMHKPEACPVPKDRLREARGIEVGHVFFLGNKYSKALNVSVTNAEGKPVTPEMGCYGIGVSRLAAAIIEASHDDSGIIWPESVAPFKVGLINIKTGDKACDDASEAAYQKLKAAGVEVLYDDRKESAGSKFATQDLIGTPWQLAIGPRGVQAGTVEVKHRKTGEKQEISLEAALTKIAS